MKRLSLISILACLLILSIPVLGQDATLESTVDPMPVEIVATSAPVEGSGNDTVINVGTPVETETPVTPAEPMPWWAVAGLEIGKLIAIYLTVVHGARAALQAFRSDPSRVAAAENAVNLVKSVTPDALEEAARIGAEKAYAATSELFAELRQTISELTDGVPAASKLRVEPTSSVSSTGGAFDSTAPRMPGN
jgi:hypothetical protein